MHRMHCYMKVEAHFHDMVIIGLVKPLTQVVKGLGVQGCKSQGLASANEAR
jgi:hypothetical protein